MFWRWLSLIQTVCFTTVMIFSAYVFITMRINFIVPDPLLPGFYPASEIPEKEYIEHAESYINSIGTYNPFNARKQFEEAKKLLAEPMTSKFNAEMMGRELTAIETTRRSQILEVNQPYTEVYRPDDDTVVVEVVGTGGKQVEDDVILGVTKLWVITMQTLEGETTNQFGIVITNVEEQVW